MTDRNDITPTASGWRRLSYTTRCGWVDWGHARPDGALELKQQIDSERGKIPLLADADIRLEGRPAYVLDYGQTMGRAGLRISATRHWVVEKGLSRAQRESVALGIFLAASHQFEQFQASPLFSWLTDSGYSGEDLVSNLVGFYSAFRDIPQSQMREICGETSVEESYRIWDTYLPNGLGAMKNRTTKPLLFGDKDAQDFPIQLTTIQPFPEGDHWVRPKGRFIDVRMISARRVTNVLRNGEIQLYQ